MVRFVSAASVAALWIAAAATPAGAAALVQTISTNSLAYGDFGTASDSLGPFPFSNFGISGGYSISTQVSAGVQGATQFAFPSINPGDVFHANTSSLNYAYTPTWTQASVGSHTGLSATASFNYDIGPFSGSKQIYDTALNATSSGTLGVGSTLSGSGANGGAAGPKVPFGYSLDALVGSASVGVNVGLNLQNAVSYTPTVQYGYYSWVNKTGTLGGGDTLTWTSVPSGALTFMFPDNLDSLAGSNDFYLNFLPAVRMDLPISASATISVPLDGSFNVEAFGQTLIDYDLPLAKLYSDTRTYDLWDDSVEWASSDFYSLKLHQDNLDCQLHPSDSCELYQVMAQPTFVSQSLLPSDTTHNFIGSSTGGFDPGLSNAPKVPGVCNPATGICYQSDDPNMPLGPGTVTFQVGGVPEPSTWALAVTGLGLTGAALRRRRRGVLATTAA